MPDGDVEYVQPRERLDAPVVLAEHDPEWMQQYAEEERRIRRALGPQARRVVHVGSTAVPGLAAKPVIDVVLEVSDSADEGAYVPRLEAIGYALHLREPAWHEHRLLKLTSPAVNLHVFTDGSSETERMVLLRDRLRAVPEERARYERAKRELASRRWAHVQDYADAKSGVVEAIVERAAAGAGEARAVDDR